MGRKKSSFLYELTPHWQQVPLANGQTPRAARRNLFRVASHSETRIETKIVDAKLFARLAFA